MEPPQRPRIITAQKFAAALVKAGVMTQDEVNRTGRIVIDVRLDRPVTLYYERWADTRLLDVALDVELGLNGIVVKTVNHHCDRLDPHSIPEDCMVDPVKALPDGIKKLLDFGYDPGSRLKGDET